MQGDETLRQLIELLAHCIGCSGARGVESRRQKLNHRFSIQARRSGYARLAAKIEGSYDRSAARVSIDFDRPPFRTS